VLSFKTVNSHDVEFFTQLLGAEKVLLDIENIERCASDHTEDFHFKPELVLQATSVEEISAIMRYCNEQSIAVTPRELAQG
jgi:glycolate oxidase